MNSGCVIYEFGTEHPTERFQVWRMDNGDLWFVIDDSQREIKNIITTIPSAHVSNLAAALAVLKVDPSTKESTP